MTVGAAQAPSGQKLCLRLQQQEDIVRYARKPLLGVGYLYVQQVASLHVFGRETNLNRILALPSRLPLPSSKILIVAMGPSLLKHFQRSSVETTGVSPYTLILISTQVVQSFSRRNAAPFC